MRLNIQSKLFFSHFAAIILVSGSVGTYFYDSAVENLIQALRSRLQNSAALISEGLNVRSLDQIRSAEDRDTPVHRQSVAALRDFVKANPDIAFIYVMRRENDKAVFVLDSDADDPALPGEVYPHEVPALMEGFVRSSVDREITVDRWGSFLSGYSPLEAGNGAYLVGIDMYADEVQSKLKEIRLAGLLSLVFSLLLAVVFSRLLSNNFTRRIGSLTGRLSTILPVQGNGALTPTGDELDQLSEALDKMSVRLDNDRQQLEAHQAALQGARDELELRVSERTSELVRTNEKLLEEIDERKRMEHRLETITRTDYLTGVLNRRAITRQLEETISGLSGDEDSFCTILVDLDHFKQINDRYGHDVGDQTLRHAVERMIHGIRDTDLLGRWGGEEFLIVFPGTGLDEAKQLAQRLCEILADSRLRAGEASVAVTGSFGVTRYVPGEDLDSCLKRTDDALYAAKAQGRNRIVVIPPG
ncbi:MAG: diguanylate cyclase [Sedimenticolaceae bacterium]